MDIILQLSRLCTVWSATPWSRPVERRHFAAAATAPGPPNGMPLVAHSACPIASETLMFHWNGMCRMPFRSLFRFDPDPNATSTQEWCGWYEANNVDQVMQTGAMGLLALVCVDISWRRMPNLSTRWGKASFNIFHCGVSVEYVGVRGRPFTVTLDLHLELWQMLSQVSTSHSTDQELTETCKPSREVWCV